MWLKSSCVLLTSKCDTNIFKAPEARIEVVPEIEVFEDAPEEPEALPMKGTSLIRRGRRNE